MTAERKEQESQFVTVQPYEYWLEVSEVYREKPSAYEALCIGRAKAVVKLPGETPVFPGDSIDRSTIRRNGQVVHGHL